MRSIASRISVMNGEGALSVFARAKELEAQGDPSSISNWASLISIRGSPSSIPQRRRSPRAKIATAR